MGRLFSTNSLNYLFLVFDELSDIGDWYVKNGYSDGAEKLIDDFYEVTQLLLKYPSSHAISTRPKLRKKNIRRIIFKKKYYIFYRYENNLIEVISIKSVKINPSLFDEIG